MHNLYRDKVPIQGKHLKIKTAMDQEERKRSKQ